MDKTPKSTTCSAMLNNVIKTSSPAVVIFTFVLIQLDLTTAQPNCEVGYHRTHRTEPCISCPIDSTTAFKGAACVCSMGFGGSVGQGCYLCPAETYSQAVSSNYFNRPCRSCPENSVSPPGSASSSDCQCHTAIGWHARVRPKDEYCVFIVGPCGAGYTGPDGECVPCDAGTYKNTTGSVACTACPSGSISPIASIVCTMCEAGSYAGSADLLACTYCQMGTFSSSAGQTACQICESNKYTFTNGATACQSCSVGEYYHRTNISAQDKASCELCKPGTFWTNNTFWPNNTCQNCPSNTWSSDEGALICNLCPGDTFSQNGSGSISTCECVAGHEGGYTRPFVAGESFLYTRQNGMYDRYDMHQERWGPITNIAKFTSAVVVGTSQKATIYFALSYATFIGMYHPYTVTFAAIAIDAAKYYTAQNNLVNGNVEYEIGYTVNGLWENKYIAAVFAPSNGNVYFIPGRVVTIGFVNTQTNVFSAIWLPFSSRFDRYSGGVLSPDGSKIYMIPYRFREFGILDVNTHVVTYMGITATDAGFLGGVMSGNGKIYCMPNHHSSHIGVLNVTGGDTYSEIDISDFKSNSYNIPFNTAILGKNGMLYLVPGDANAICVIDPTTDVVSVLIDISGFFPDPLRSKYSGGVLVDTDKIYLVPDNAQHMGLVTLSASGPTFELLQGFALNTANNAYSGGVELFGSLYMIPGLRDAIDVVDLNLPQGCTACATDTYRFSGAEDCIKCPAHSSSPFNASKFDRCVCDTGYTGADSGTCTACVSGKFKDVAGSAACVTCPMNFSSPEASLDATECTCGKGSSGPEGGPCTLCVPGKHKNVLGYTACTLCGTGTYSVAAGQEDCDKCSAGQYSTVVGASSADVCTLCVAGKYTMIPGSVECSNCSSGQYSSMVGGNSSDVCKVCPSNSDSFEASDNETDCICQPGSSGFDGGPCTRCVAGKYKIVPGVAACENCSADTFSATVGATSNASCRSCEGWQVSVSGSSTCTTCQNGLYKPTDSQTCEICLVEHFCASGRAVRCNEHSTTMPANRTDAGSARDCQCKPGYAHRTEEERGTDSNIFDNNCHACTPGYYNSEFNSTQCSACASGYFSTVNASLSIDNCQECPVHTFSGSGHSKCTQCPDNAQAPAGSGEVGHCQCNVGYSGADDSTCNACGNGKYKNEPGEAACTMCPANSHAPAASNEKIDCICNAGSAGPDGGDCTKCLAGTYKNATGSTACVVCPSNSSSSEGSTTITACQCNAGFTGPNGGTCTQCVAGKFKVATGDEPCSDCGTGHYSATVGATSDACLECTANSDAPAASDERTDCICNAG